MFVNFETLYNQLYLNKNGKTIMSNCSCFIYLEEMVSEWKGGECFFGDRETVHDY